jgi:hypothetical protein
MFPSSTNAWAAQGTISTCPASCLLICSRIWVAILQDMGESPVITRILVTLPGTLTREKKPAIVERNVRFSTACRRKWSLSRHGHGSRVDSWCLPDNICRAKLRNSTCTPFTTLSFYAECFPLDLTLRLDTQCAAPNIATSVPACTPCMIRRPSFKTSTTQLVMLL